MANRDKEKIELSVIILNYKTDELILDLLSGLTPDPRLEVLIVDNSPKNSLEKKLPKRPDLHYHFTGKNLGFSGGNNLGLDRAKGEWIFMLNSDTKTNTKDVLSLLDITKDNYVLVSTPKLIQPDGVIQNNVGFFDPFFVNPINAVFARPRMINCSAVKDNKYVDCMTGAAMLIHRSVFEKIGTLDDKKFFMYFEDIDFSQRLNKAGIKILFIPSVRIIHYGGVSSGADIRQKNVNYQNGLQTYISKNRGPLVNLLNNIFHPFK